MRERTTYTSTLIQKPYELRRLAGRRDLSKGTRTYDDDNLYPQRVAALADASKTGTACINNLSRYLYGDSFENETLKKAIINPFTGMTADKLLKEISYDKSKFNAFALHINYNLAGKITAVTPLKSKNCRFGLQVNDITMETEYIAYSPNWDRYTLDLINKTQIVEYYHIFNPDPKKVREEIKQAGGINNYKGQVLYCTPEKNIYPMVRFDAVLNCMQFEDEISRFDISTILNKLNSDYIVRYPGGFSSNKEREAVEEKFQDFIGSENASNLMMIELDPRFVEAGDIKVIEAIPQVNKDKLYELTAKRNQNAIIESFQVPKPLIGIQQEGGLISQTNYVEAHKIYNSHTSMERAELTDELTPIFDNFYMSLGGNYRIKPKSLEGFEEPKQNQNTEQTQNQEQEQENNLKQDQQQDQEQTEN